MGKAFEQAVVFGSEYFFGILGVVLPPVFGCFIILLCEIFSLFHVHLSLTKVYFFEQFRGLMSVFEGDGGEIVLVLLVVVRAVIPEGGIKLNCARRLFESFLVEFWYHV